MTPCRCAQKFMAREMNLVHPDRLQHTLNTPNDFFLHDAVHQVHGQTDLDGYVTIIGLTAAPEKPLRDQSRISVRLSASARVGSENCRYGVAGLLAAIRLYLQGEVHMSLA